MAAPEANQAPRAALRALWVGGPPGKTMTSITAALARSGVDVVEQIIDVSKWRMRDLTGFDVVLVNKEMVPHPACDQARDNAKAQGVTWAWSYISTVRTLLGLQRAGVVVDVEDAPVDVAPVPDHEHEYEDRGGGFFQCECGDWRLVTEHIPDDDADESGEPVTTTTTANPNETTADEAHHEENEKRRTPAPYFEAIETALGEIVLTPIGKPRSLVFDSLEDVPPALLNMARFR